MSGALSMLMASGAGGSGGGSFAVTVGVGSNFNLTPIQTNWAYGWADVGYTPGAGAIFNTQFVAYTVCPVGSAVSPSLPVTVIGIYSAGGSAGNASYYVVLTDGDTTVSAPSFATTMTVDGVSVGGTRSAPVYRSGSLAAGAVSKPCTQYLFTLAAPAATLFGTTAGAVKTVVIA